MLYCVTLNMRIQFQRVLTMVENTEIIGLSFGILGTTTFRKLNLVISERKDGIMHSVGSARKKDIHYGDRLRTHPNHLAVNLLRLPDNRRLCRFLATDLPDGF
jgi:hypothetical protein